MKMSLFFHLFGGAKVVPTGQAKLFPTIDHSFFSNDGFFKKMSVLEEDYLEVEPSDDSDFTNARCHKRADHFKFIGINDLSFNNLPTLIQHEYVVRWIKYSAQLVVRLNNERSGYGTGRAFVMRNHLEREFPCTETRCIHLNDHKVYGGLGIITCKHVVEDDTVAIKTEVDFFYNDMNRLDEAVKEYGKSVYFINDDWDYVVFTCSMHNSNFFQRVQLCSDISAHYWRQIPEHIKRYMKDYAIVFSHPHGALKRVSFGRVVGNEFINDDRTGRENQMHLRSLLEQYGNADSAMFDLDSRYNRNIRVRSLRTYYDAATCPGSSGAPVYMGNAFLENGEEVNPPHTHRGMHPDICFNYCDI